MLSWAINEVDGLEARVGVGLEFGVLVDQEIFLESGLMYVGL